MRLDKIKLAGFKSFVDPTIVNFPSNLSGVVGPNGCGKSNIIDAVRWVMGESSAKYLRGESIADVIFNGSLNRSPSGQAAIELHFDNTSGRLGGAYEQYDHIVVRRQVNLEGHSTYYLNGGVCRRRDITDIFLGTGLGPRSYAIIEQGTISRLIEAKPQDLRIYLEEAAGISKYKERRRETELRLGHTRDNLTRLTDIRNELQKQLDHLSKQAQTAEKYQLLKQQEKNLKAEIFALRARKMQHQITQLETVISELELKLAACNTQIQSLLTDREAQQQNQIQHQEILQATQKSCYEINTALARLEQQIQHHREQKQQLEKNLIQIKQEYAHAQSQLTQENTQHQVLQDSHQVLLPQLTQAKQQLESASLVLTELDTAFHEAQKNWEDFHHQSSLHLQTSQVEQTKIQHLEKHLSQMNTRIERLGQEQAQFAQLTLNIDLDSLQGELRGLEAETKKNQILLSGCQAQINQLRTDIQHQHQQLDKYRTELQALKGRFASVQALQESALGKNIESRQSWLKKNQLDNYPRLAEKLNVETGWECAVETVLSEQLEAVCVDNLQEIIQIFSRADSAADQIPFSINLLDTKFSADFNNVSPDKFISLASKCQMPDVLKNFLSNIYIAENLPDALEKLQQLDAGASVITRQGIWLGQGWMRMIKSDDQKGSVMLRKKTLNLLQAEINVKTQTVQQTQIQLEQAQQQLKQLEILREEKQKTVSGSLSKEAELKTQLKIQASQFAQHEQRKAQLFQEIQELNTQKAQEQQALTVSRAAWESALAILDQDSAKRGSLNTARENLRVKLQASREEHQKYQQFLHVLSTQLKVLETQQKSNADLSERLNSQIQQLEAKKTDTQQKLESFLPLEIQYQEELEKLLASQQTAEKTLQQNRADLSVCDSALRETEQALHRVEENRSQLQTELEKNRIAFQSACVGIEGLRNQCQEIGENLENLWETLAAEADCIVHEENLAKITLKIEKLGLINLAAITEHTQHLERKTYLDTQHQDLTTALEILEDAIHKIDKETRARFKETYEKVNQLFGELFPVIFGGGQAYLQLTGENLSETGVEVIARPPGKRNSTIHLLSGGEKALTAIALVFSIFQLNPAPFCMLDEVDAPLDDANIGRFCDLVKKMSESVQFIFISHNKIAIEMAEHLIGITMNEPGVSRLVAVDVKAAIEMAEA